MERLRKLLGTAGLALILIGAVTYGILHPSGVAAALPLAAGLLLSAASLILSYRGVTTEGRRRSARLGVHTGASILFLAGTLIFLQTILSRHAVSLDATANGRLSLAPQTMHVLAGLTSEITVVCFYTAGDPEKLGAEDLLTEYVRSCRFIRYRFVDPDGDPATARRYRVTKGGSVVVERGGTAVTVTGASEEKITNAIIRVSRSDQDRSAVCFMTGHGEKDLDGTGADGLSELKQTLEVENRIIRELAPADRIPDDCDVLVFAGPETDLFPGEGDEITAYLAAGGDAFLLLDPLTDCRTLAGIAALYGVSVGDDIVLNLSPAPTAGALYAHYFVRQYTRHIITEGFRQAAYFPRSRSISVVKETPPGVTAEELAMTSDEAYAETNLEDFERGVASFTADEDRAGPVPVVAVSSRVLPGGARRGVGDSTAVTSRLVVFGDSDCATNGYLSVGGNRDLILNALGWLAEEEAYIAIRPRQALIQPVMLSPRQERIVFWLPVIGLPVLVLGIGTSVHIARRRSA